MRSIWLRGQHTNEPDFFSIFASFPVTDSNTRADCGVYVHPVCSRQCSNSPCNSLHPTALPCSPPLPSLPSPAAQSTRVGSEPTLRTCSPPSPAVLRQLSTTLMLQATQRWGLVRGPGRTNEDWCLWPPSGPGSAQLCLWTASWCVAISDFCQ